MTHQRFSKLIYVCQRQFYFLICLKNELFQSDTDLVGSVKQTSKPEHFAKTVNGIIKMFIFFAKRSILEVQQCIESAYLIFDICLSTFYTYWSEAFHQTKQKQPLESCSAVFTEVSFKHQSLLYKSAAYLKHRRTSTMELSCINSQRFSVANYYHAKLHLRASAGV